MAPSVIKPTQRRKVKEKQDVSKSPVEKQVVEVRSSSVVKKGRGRPPKKTKTAS